MPKTTLQHGYECMRGEYREIFLKCRFLGKKSSFLVKKGGWGHFRVKTGFLGHFWVKTRLFWSFLGIFRPFPPFSHFFCKTTLYWQLLTANSVDYRVTNPTNAHILKHFRKHKSLPIGREKESILVADLNLKLKRGCFEYTCEISAEFDKRSKAFYRFDVTCPLRNRIPSLGKSGEDLDCSIVSDCKKYLDKIVIPKFVKKVELVRFQNMDSVKLLEGFKKSKNCRELKEWELVGVKYRVVLLKCCVWGEIWLFEVVFGSKNVILSRFWVKTCHFRSFWV